MENKENKIEQLFSTCDCHTSDWVCTLGGTDRQVDPSRCKTCPQWREQKAV